MHSWNIQQSKSGSAVNIILGCTLRLYKLLCKNYQSTAGMPSAVLRGGAGIEMFMAYFLDASMSINIVTDSKPSVHFVNRVKLLMSW